MCDRLIGHGFGRSSGPFNGAARYGSSVVEDENDPDITIWKTWYRGYLKPCQQMHEDPGKFNTARHDRHKFQSSGY